MSVQIKGSGTIGGIDEGLNITGVTTATNFKTGSSNLHSTGLTVGNNFLHTTGINVGTGATIHVPATNVLTLGTNSNERVRITSGGSVNLGTGELTQTTRKFNVYGGAARVTQTAGGNTIEAFGHTTSGQSYGLLVNAGSTSADYAAEFRNKDATSLLRIRGDGKVGINTTSPTLNGNEEGIHIVSEDYPTLHLTNSTTGHAANNGSMFTLNDTGETIIRNGHASHIRFDTNNGSSIGERLRIGSAGQIGIGGANYGSSGQVLTSQGSGSAVQWASPAAPSVSQNTGTANNNIYQSVATGVTWGSGLNGTEQTVGNIAYCNTSDVYAIDVYLGMTFNHGGGTYNYNSTHCYLTGYLFQSGKNYLNDGSWTHAQHFDMYYNAFGTVYTIPWDPSGTQTLKFRVDYAYNTNTNNTFGFYVISKHLK